MKKIFSTILALFLIFNTSFVFAKNNIWNDEKSDAFNFLLDKWIIKATEKNHLDDFISKAQFWKISLLSAGYMPNVKKDFFLTPIKWIQPDKWYSQYANSAYKNWLLDKYKWKEIDPDSKMRKLESLGFAFELFWISTPMFNDMIMDFKDVKNDHPTVSKCLQIWFCQWETDFIFWANKKITKIEAYVLVFRSYNFVYESWENLNQAWSLPLLTEVYSAIINEYYKAWDLSSSDLLYWAAEWMADSVWDKYTTFMRPTKSKNFNEGLDWSFQWIWAYVEKEKEWIRIVTPINWSPAKKAGLKAGDLVIEIEWENVIDLTLEEWIALIKWPEWTFVNIKIKRWNDYLDFRIKRAKVVIPSVQERVEDWILIITVNQFWQKTFEEIRDLIQENDKINSIIFDLRHNPWWYLSVAENTLSLFVESWEIIVQIKYPKYKATVKSTPDIKKIKGKKIVILIDEGSASASEIFAWTMQDYWLAEIIWTTSYWKWTVQTIMEFVDGSQFKYTIANWMTWKWNPVDWVWVIPDIEVENDVEKFWDEILNKAKNVIR